MKRKILILLSVSVVLISAGWMLPRLLPYGKAAHVFAASILIGSGLFVSYLLTFLVFRLFHIEWSSVSRGNRWAVYLAIGFVGIAFALGFNLLVGRSLVTLLLTEGSFARHSVRMKFFDDLIESLAAILAVFFWISLFYILVRIYEETIEKRARRFSRLTFLQGGWKLMFKLLVGGVLVFLLVISVSSNEWVRMAEFGFERPWLRRREHDDSIGVVFVVSEGKSHAWYFNAVHKISTTLQEARVILVPLPRQLSLDVAGAATVEKMSRLGHVVFAVAPEEKAFLSSAEDELWVRQPVKKISDEDWGVISIQRLPRFWAYDRFYPLAYREIESGVRVPDAAVRVVQKFLRRSKEVSLDTDGRRFRLGDYETGLSADESLPILGRVWVGYEQFARASSLVDETFEWFDSWASDKRISAEQVASRFKGKIVIVWPSENISSHFQFGLIYVQVVHHFLKGYSVAPLDRWTRLFIGIQTFLAILFFWLFRPWIASLAVLFLTAGEGFLFHWLNVEHRIIVEAMPLFLAGAFSIPLFIFLRVNHERGDLHVAEKQRALQELRTAHEMQMGLMPTQDPIFPGFEISGITKPAEEVGGDFFDYVWLDEAKTKLGIAVADVSGKAMKAAMTAVLTSGMLYREIGSKDTPKSILSKINKPLHLKTDKRIFTAMTFALINRKAKSLSHSNAGQMLPLLKRNGRLQHLKVGGPRLPLGIREDTAYQESSIKMRKGDVVFFYSDGIPEAMNDKSELFGFERFETLVRNLPVDISAQELSAKILNNISEFTKDTPQHDDMTVVVVKVI